MEAHFLSKYRSLFISWSFSLCLSIGLVHLICVLCRIVTNINALEFWASLSNSLHFKGLWVSFNLESVVKNGELAWAPGEWAWHLMEEQTYWELLNLWGLRYSNCGYWMAELNHGTSTEAETECCFFSRTLLILVLILLNFVLYWHAISHHTHLRHTYTKQTTKAKQKNKNNRETTRQVVNDSFPVPWISLSSLSPHCPSDDRLALTVRAQCVLRFVSPAVFYSEPFPYHIIPAWVSAVPRLCEPTSPWALACLSPVVSSADPLTILNCTQCPYLASLFECSSGLSFIWFECAWSQIKADDNYFVHLISYILHRFIFLKINIFLLCWSYCYFQYFLFYLHSLSTIY